MIILNVSFWIQIIYARDIFSSLKYRKPIINRFRYRRISSESSACVLRMGRADIGVEEDGLRILRDIFDDIIMEKKI